MKYLHSSCIKVVFRNVFFVAAGLSLSANSFSQEQAGEPPLKFEASYVGDVVGNLRGGIKTGAKYLGLANMAMSVNTENAGWWRGGEFFVKGASTHGSSPTERLVGDFQTLSNIDGGNHTFLFELWYKQAIGNVELKFGLQDLNAEFANSDNGALFINSSFGIPSVIPDNVPAPVFPLTAVGLSLQWNVTEFLGWKGIVYGGQVYDFDDNEYNVRWNINPNDGVLAVTEFNITPECGSTCVYKVGGYYFDNGSDSDDDYNYGFYFIGDQTLWSGGSKRLDLFAQAAVSPKNRNSHNYYLGGGLNLYGLFDKRGENCLGLAVAHAGFDDSEFRHETVIEACYKAAFLEHFYLQPDLQYIISPAGGETDARNAFAAILRFGVEF